MPDSQWYKADDSIVTKVQEREALNQEAYILFYQQIQQLNAVNITGTNYFYYIIYVAVQVYISNASEYF